VGAGGELPSGGRIRWLCASPPSALVTPIGESVSIALILLFILVLGWPYLTFDFGRGDGFRILRPSTYTQAGTTRRDSFDLSRFSSR
jgi:hypothetical protein